MLKWLVAVLIGLVILAVVAPKLRLPGDFRFAIRGRTYYIPLASSVALSLLVYAISKLL